MQSEYKLTLKTFDLPERPKCTICGKAATAGHWVVIEASGMMPKHDNLYTCKNHSQHDLDVMWNGGGIKVKTYE